MAETKVDVRSYTFQHGTKPTRPEGRYPARGLNHETTRETSMDSRGCWVVTWTTRSW